MPAVVVQLLDNPAVEAKARRMAWEMNNHVGFAVAAVLVLDSGIGTAAAVAEVGVDTSVVHLHDLHDSMVHLDPNELEQLELRNHSSRMGSTHWAQVVEVDSRCIPSQL